MNNIKKEYIDNIKEIENLAEELFHEWHNQNYIMGTTEYYIYKIWKLTKLNDELQYLLNKIYNSDMTTMGEICKIICPTDLIIEIEEITNKLKL